MIRLLAIVVLTVRVAHAGSCPPTVVLTGDDDAVRDVREQLAARGIVDQTPSCPALHAQVERRGAQLVVRLVPEAPGVQALGRQAPAPLAHGIERMVGGPATAATVIESWVRSDVAAPLLESRDVPALAIVATPSAPPPPPAAATGIQLFAAAETSLASDRTVWQGLELGACVMLGPVCAAARVRAAKVIARPDGWHRFKRKSVALFAGVDVPIAVGRLRLRPGFSAGYGSMLTHGIGDDGKASLEVSGPCAEVHVGLSIPVSARIAIDLATIAELTQAASIEAGGMLADTSVAFPDEPRALFRLAVGIRYGAL